MNSLSSLGMLARSLGEMEKVKRKVFISFFQDNRSQVDEFIAEFSTRLGIFTPKALGVAYNDDIINSNDTAYVMQQIRDEYLGDSSVTIVMLGTCTHSRRYVDWEIKASLQQGKSTPNGLIGILIPGLKVAHLPDRFSQNWNKNLRDCYARYYFYPENGEILREWIEDAYSAKTKRAKYIVNPNEIMKYNSKCLQCGITHKS